MQGFKNLVATRDIPDIAPPGDLTATIVSPPAIFVSEMRSQISQLLLLAKEFCVRSIPA